MDSELQHLTENMHELAVTWPWAVAGILCGFAIVYVMIQLEKRKQS